MKEVSITPVSSALPYIFAQSRTCSLHTAVGSNK